MLYGMGIAFRNTLFDTGILPSVSPSVPVVCVGNLSTGGTGKTPFIEYLVRLLKDRLPLAVLSRGYRRSSRGFLVVTPGMDPDRAGDEPLQVATAFPGVAVACDADRRNGIRRLTRDIPGLGCILLDDGYQHRYVKPALSVLLTDYSHRFTGDRLLPAGTLREPARQSRRADIIVVTKCPVPDAGLRAALEAEFRPHPGQMFLLSGLEHSPLAGRNGEPLPEGPPPDVLGICGLAAPASFRHHLEKAFPGAVTVIFPDHHRYTGKDIRTIAERFGAMRSSNKIIVTTGKDFVKLDREPGLAHLPLYRLPVRVVFHGDDGRRFDEKILETCSIRSTKPSIT